MIRFLRRLAALALILVPMVGRAPALDAQALNLTPAAEHGVESFAVDPRGRFAVYVEDGRVFSRRLDRASLPVLLTGSFVGDPFSPTTFAISPDGSRVVFSAGGTFQREIFAVPIDGSAPPVRLNGPLAASGYVAAFRIGPDGTRVVYLADEDGDSSLELRSVPIDAFTTSVELDGLFLHPLPFFEVGPDAQQVVFEGYFDGTLASQSHLFSVPIDGSGPAVHLNQAIANTRLLDFRLAPAGNRLVFWAEKTQFTTKSTRLYSVRIDGVGGAVQISATGGNVWLLKGDTTRVPFAISPDGTRVVYVADHDKANQLELWSVPIDDSAPPIRLNGTMVQGGDVSTSDPNVLPFALRPDGATAVYSADQELNDRVELYLVPIEGGAPPTKLSGPIVALGGVRSFRLDPPGVRAAYVADQDTDDVFELYSVRLDGASAPVKLSDPVTVYAFGPDGADVVYVANQDLAAGDEIYRVASQGGSSPRRISPPSLAGGGVRASPPLAPLAFQSAGGPRVLFAGDLATRTVDELYLGYLGKPLLPVPPPAE